MEHDPTATAYVTYYGILLAFGLIAQCRGRNGLYWSALALVITPIFAGLFLWLVTSKRVSCVARNEGSPS
jgi:hypothetical protein